MKDLKVIYILLSALLLAFTSCEDTVEVGEYDNWQDKNIAFIDSIATVARANSDSKWKVIPAMGIDDSKEHGNEYYVYCYAPTTRCSSEETSPPARTTLKRPPLRLMMRLERSSTVHMPVVPNICRIIWKNCILLRDIS